MRITPAPVSSIDAYLIATIVMYSLGYWIGGTIFLIMTAFDLMAYSRASEIAES